MSAHGKVMNINRDEDVKRFRLTSLVIITNMSIEIQYMQGIDHDMLPRQNMAEGGKVLSFHLLNEQKCNMSGITIFTSTLTS